VRQKENENDTLLNIKNPMENKFRKEEYSFEENENDELIEKIK